jgi:16S rRNA (guanine527-N7)-methyltransferase
MIESEDEARSWLASLPECDEQAMDRIERLIALLRVENERQNLVSRASFDAIWRRHIADSAQLLTLVPRGISPWMDLGTGAGFPGLVIAALRPECDVLLVESRARRIGWLESVTEALCLDHTRVLGRRLELLEARKMAAISARAFAPLDKLLSLSSRFSTAKTLWVLPKGRSAQQEVGNLKGWRHAFHVEQSMTESQSGIIVGQLFGRKGKSS